MRISVVIPAFNEEQAIAGVVRAVPAEQVKEILVVDNASTDDTAKQAARAGARVIHEPRPGYGFACLAGAKAAADADVIVFLDGDRSDDPGQMDAIVGPLRDKRADLVIGSRLKGVLERGAMPFHGRAGNRIIVFLLRLLYGVKLTDIGSFRAIGARRLHELNMQEMTYGWPIEMVVKAGRRGMRILSVPISYRRRIGESKVTGTVRGSILATCSMLSVLLKYLFKK